MSLICCDLNTLRGSVRGMPECLLTASLGTVKPGDRAGLFPGASSFIISDKRNPMDNVDLKIR
jgi:hypothetical protein